MTQNFTLYDIYSLGAGWDDEPFEISCLPFDICEGVRIEHVKPFFKDDTFAYARERMGSDAVKQLEKVDYALVHRFTAPHNFIQTEGKTVQQEFDELVRNVAACLRLIRPMRQHAMMMQGTVQNDGSFDVTSFDHPIDLLEVPQNQKLFHLQNRDADDLKNYAPLFLLAMRGEFWKFRMAAQFHELGFFQGDSWKARYLLWASSIESIYTSHNSEHNGSMVARERIKWFLGENTSIYPKGELSNLLKDPKITVGAIVEPLYEVRNFLAHGDRIPDEYFQKKIRNGFGLDDSLNLMGVLAEAQSFIIRYSLLKILREGLLNHFTGAVSAQAYFSSHGLTNSKLRNRP